MVWMRFSRIERGEVFTRHSLIDEYCSREWDIINIRYIDADILFTSGEIFLTPADEIGFVGIGNFDISIDIDIGLDIIYLLYSDFSYSDIFESFSPVSSRTRWPLLPVVSTIENRECTACWVEELEILDEKTRDTPPSSGLLYDPHRSPEYDPM
jgi:hypothetical protein